MEGCLLRMDVNFNLNINIMLYWYLTYKNETSEKQQPLTVTM